MQKVKITLGETQRDLDFQSYFGHIQEHIG